MKKVLVLLSFLCIIISCGKVFSEKDELQPADAFSERVKRIDRSVVFMSEADIRILSDLYSKTSLTKSSDREIKEIIPIKNDNGKVLMYAVNYADGYIIVSATRKYYPILADVPCGSFSFKNEGEGSDLLIKELSEQIDIAGAVEGFPDLSKYWAPYVEPARVVIEKTKANSDYYDLFESYLNEWYADGCSVYYLYNKPENMSDDMYNAFYRMAEDDMAEVSGYPFRECAVITEQSFETSDIKGPFLKTKWDQDKGFNSQVPDEKMLGCVTVAVGQIMKHHEYPRNYNWAAMANDIATETTASFLAKLRKELDVSDKGESTIGHAKNVFENYGYSCSNILSHDNTKVVTALSKNNPVYMRGSDKIDTKTGHAWVCDGYRYTIPSRKYTLYLLTFEDGKPSSFESWYEETVYDSYPFFFHMNWGWGGIRNGYYLDSDIDLSKYGVKCDFSVHRKDLIISGHN